MRKPIRAAVAVVAAALFTSLNATASMAATKATWSVSPGGAITGTAASFEVEDQATDAPVLYCTSSGLTGSLKSGSGLSGAGIGTVRSVTFSNCSAGSQPATVSTGTVKWSLGAGYYGSTSGVTHGKIRGIHLAVSSSTCSFVADGTSATARDGMVKVAYSNSTGQLAISPYHGTLHLYNVTGCGGLGATGDEAQVTSAYAITPGQTITSP